MIPTEGFIEVLVFKLNKLAKACINSTFDSSSTNMDVTQTSFLGMGPGGSGPIQNDEEIVCDITTEIISTLFKLFSRLLEM